MTKPAKSNIVKLSENKKARFNYNITDTLECGIVLMGCEVKSIRDRHLSFADSYALLKNNELFLIGLRIEPFKQATHDEINPERTRKLLAHRKEIKKITKLRDQKNISLVPLKIYLKNNLVKVLLGIGTGKTNIDKRRTIKERDTKRELSRVLKRG